MEGCFIKKIFLGKQDKTVHSQFVRFGKGEYKGRALLSLVKTSKVKIKSSFEFANDFVKLIASLANINFSGVILSKEELNLTGKKKSGIFNYEFSGNSKQVLDVIDKAYYLLLDGEAEGISLKIKKKLPKPGKREGKVDDGFCSLEADLKYWPAIKDYFFWDIPECSKCKIEHIYEITDLVLPQGEKDFEQIRILTKRKGKLKRKITIEKDQQSEKEVKLEV